MKDRVYITIAGRKDVKGYYNEVYLQRLVSTETGGSETIEAVGKDALEFEVALHKDKINLHKLEIFRVEIYERVDKETFDLIREDCYRRGVFGIESVAV